MTGIYVVADCATQTRAADGEAETADFRCDHAVRAHGIGIGSQPTPDSAASCRSARRLTLDVGLHPRNTGNLLA